MDLDCEAVSSQHHDWTQRRPPLKRVVTTAVTTLWWHHSESHEPARVMNAIEGVGCSRLQVVLMDVCVGIDQTSSMTLLGIPSVLSLWHSNGTALTSGHDTTTIRWPQRPQCVTKVKVLCCVHREHCIQFMCRLQVGGGFSNSCRS